MARGRNIPVHTFRPRQVDLVGQRSAMRAGSPLLMSARQWTRLAVLTVAAVVLCLGLSQFLQGKTALLAAKIEQLHLEHAELARTNMRLLATNLELSSKSSLAALTRNKVRLFDPVRGQVRRISIAAGGTPMLRKENNYLTYQEVSLPESRNSRP